MLPSCSFTLGIDEHLERGALDDRHPGKLLSWVLTKLERVVIRYREVWVHCDFLNCKPLLLVFEGDFNSALNRVSASVLGAHHTQRADGHAVILAT